MKTTIIFFIIFLCQDLSAMVDTIRIKSKITDVTVFFSGAQVSRKASLIAKKGKHVVILEQITSEIEEKSIQVNGIKNCKTLSVKYQLILPDEKNKAKEQKDLEDQIKLLDLKLKELKDNHAVFEIEEKLLIDNSLLSKKNDGTFINDIKVAADFYRQRLNEIRKGMLNITVNIDETTKQIQELYATLNKLTIKRRQPHSQIIIVINAETDIKTDLIVNYYLKSAGWTPTYDFRVSEVTEPLNIVYNANVFQTSNENWDNVNLKLSTGNPALKGNKPELIKWNIEHGNHKPEVLEQNGSSALSGRVIDMESKEPMDFAQIVVLQNDKTIASTITNMDGQFNIKPIPFGVYIVRVNFVGYSQVEATGIAITSDKPAILNFEMASSSVGLSEVRIKAYKNSIVNNDYNGRTMVNGQPSLSSSYGTNSKETSGSYSYNGETPSFRGARTSGTAYYINGVRVIGTNYISKSLRSYASNLEYEIELPYSIPSDGADYSIKIKELNVAVNYTYHTVPKLDNGVFLTASLPNWSDLDLLTAKANIFYQETYVGQTQINTELTSDTLSISLGRDRNIIVERISNKNLLENKILGNSIKETIGWTINVRNNKKVGIKLIVEDQIPISERKSIQIESIDLVDGKLDNETGIIIWTLDLAANEKKELNLKYSVKYPKYLSIDLK